MQMAGSAGDHDAGLEAAAVRLVDAVAAVVEAPPGLRAAPDLPLVTGRGLVG